MKVYKALSKASMAEIDFEAAGMDEEGIRDYFSRYSLKRLKSFYDGYNSCLSILMELGQTATSDTQETIYATYHKRMKIVSDILDMREKQTAAINQKISDLQKEQKQFQKDHDFQSYLGEHYLEFCKYRREDTYSNSNYISDGLTDSECLQKAKELIEAAEKEAKKACVLQRTVSTSMNNLFALPEFEPFYDKFALYNYIRIRTENGLIQSANYETGKSGSMLDLTNGTFDYAGGKLTYNNNTLTVKGNVTANELIATNKGRLANFNISENELYTDDYIDVFDDNNKNIDNKGIYFGKNGLAIGNNFRVNNNGNCFFKGNIDATSITAKEQYFVNSGGHEIPLISAKCAPLGSRWIVNIHLATNKGITLIDYPGLSPKTETEINTDSIIFQGNAYFKNNIYSNTGEIITSDKNLKHEIQELDKENQISLWNSHEI